MTGHACAVSEVELDIVSSVKPVGLQVAQFTVAGQSALNVGLVTTSGMTESPGLRSLLVEVVIEKVFPDATLVSKVVAGAVTAALDVRVSPPDSERTDPDTRALLKVVPRLVVIAETLAGELGGEEVDGSSVPIKDVKVDVGSIIDAELL